MLVGLPFNLLKGMDDYVLQLRAEHLCTDHSTFPMLDAESHEISIFGNSSIKRPSWTVIGAHIQVYKPI